MSDINLSILISIYHLTFENHFEEDIKVCIKATINVFWEKQPFIIGFKRTTF